jgi:hypothetical protein
MILCGGGVTLACADNGEVQAHELHGLFAGDTRMLSTYRFAVASQPWRVLTMTQQDPSAARWDMQNPRMWVNGVEIEEGAVHLRLERTLHGALRDEITLTSFARDRILLRFALLVDADFVDVFQVKDRSIPAHFGFERVGRKDGFSFVYERQSFRRALHVRFGTPGFTVVGPQVMWDLVLEPHCTWRCTIQAESEVDGERLRFGALRPRRGPEIRCAPRLQFAFKCGERDLERLALGDIIAAGAPWFMTLFGRDALTTSLMAPLIGSWHGRAALDALGRLQATERDDFRDAMPGKIVHEMRRGELASFCDIPHAPYYGTHDAPALYVLALANLWRWTGDRELLQTHLGHAEAALAWCEREGDLDGDGLLEYQTRSKKGYYNQGWKDAGDAIVREGFRSPSKALRDTRILSAS